MQPDSHSHQSARVIFDFTPTSPFELAVSGKDNYTADDGIPLIVDAAWTHRGHDGEGHRGKLKVDKEYHVWLNQIHNGKDDDGSGWVKVSNDQGGKGLVPASYVEYLEETDNAPSAPIHSRPSQGSGQYGSYYIDCHCFIFAHYRGSSWAL